jgi:hypothetical protein
MACSILFSGVLEALKQASICPLQHPALQAPDFLIARATIRISNRTKARAFASSRRPTNQLAHFPWCVRGRKGGLAPSISWSIGASVRGSLVGCVIGPRAATRCSEEIDVSHNVEVIRVVHDDVAVPEAHYAAFRNRRQQRNHFHRDRLNQRNAFRGNETADADVRPI